MSHLCNFEAYIKLEGDDFYRYTYNIEGLRLAVKIIHLNFMSVCYDEDIRELADILHVKGVPSISFSNRLCSGIGYLFSKPIPRLSRIHVEVGGFDTSLFPKDVWLVVRASVSVKGFKKLDIRNFYDWAIPMVREFTGTHLMLDMLYECTLDKPGCIVNAINDAIRRNVTHLRCDVSARLLEADRLDVLADFYGKCRARVKHPRAVSSSLYSPMKDMKGERRYRRKVHKLLGSTTLPESIIENIASM